MSHLKVLKSVFCAFLLFSSVFLLGQNNYVLVTKPSSVNDVCSRHGLTNLSQSTSDSSSHGVFLVSSSSVDPTISTDSSVQSFESNRSLGVAELSGTTEANLTQSTTTILDQLPGRAIVSYFGSAVANYYVSQPATSIARLADVQSTSSWNGSGVTVAVIDTGVDPNHPALSSVLVPGFDFVHNTPGASELVDLDPALAAALTQSTTTILDGGNVYQMNSFTGAILSQSTTTILDGPPSSFGHGTMMAAWST